MLHVSLDLLTVYETVKSSDEWVGIRQIAAKSGISERATDHHCRRLSDAGVFQCTWRWRGFRYRLAKTPSPERTAMLESASQIRRRARGFSAPRHAARLGSRII